MKIHGGLQTVDGAWRVQVVQRGRHVAYGLLRDGEVYPSGITTGIGISEVRYYLRKAGIDMADLVEAPGQDAA